MLKNRLKKLAQIHYKSGNLDLYDDTIFTIAQITVGNNRDYEYEYDEGRDVFRVTKDDKSDGQNYVGSEYGPEGESAYAYQRIVEYGKGPGVEKAKAKQDERKRSGEFRAATFESIQGRLRQRRWQEQGAGSQRAAAGQQEAPAGQQGVGVYPSSVQSGLVRVRQGINIVNISPELSKFIEELGIVAQKMGAQTPIIVSGYRDNSSQAAIMISNWKRNGGLYGGDQYMNRLYGSKGPGVNAIIRRYKIGTQQEQYQQGHAELVRYLETYLRSQHTLSPARAVDVSSGTTKIYEVLRQINSEGKVRINIGDERWSENPHFHISV